DFSEIFSKYDYSFIGGMAAIFVIGVLNLYSATHADPEVSDLYRSQIMWFLLAVAIAVGISFINPKTLFRYSYFLYGFNIFLLVLVLLLGKKGMGAQRWLVMGPFRLQPSELMKVTLVLGL